MEQINNNPKLFHGLQVAKKEYLQECNRRENEDMEL